MVLDVKSKDLSEMHTLKTLLRRSFKTVVKNSLTNTAFAV